MDIGSATTEVRAIIMIVAMGVMAQRRLNVSYISRTQAGDDEFN